MQDERPTRVRSEIQLEVTYNSRENMTEALESIVHGLRQIRDVELYMLCLHVRVPANMNMACFLAYVHPLAMEVANQCCDGKVEFKYGSSVVYK